MAREALNFPVQASNEIRLRVENDQEFIWDPSRKKWLVCTPEEWVRQHAVQWLKLFGFAFEIMQMEGCLKTLHKSKRSDILIYKGGKPWLLVECKAPSVKLSQETFNQAFNYNQTLKAPYLYLTNGLQHLFWDASSHQQLFEPPFA
jgi:hypothetical protein